MWRGISLANKCLLLFGGAVVLIVLAALSVPWLRMNALVDESQLEVSRELVSVWERLDSKAGLAGGGEEEYAGIRARRLTLEEARREASDKPLLRRALKLVESDPKRADAQTARWAWLTREYRYVKAVRTAAPPGGTVVAGGAEPGALVGVIVLERRPFDATWRLMLNALFLLGAGLVVLGLAVLVFYFITHKLILSPVRALTETAARIQEGDLAVRADLRTGDEFEELSGTFNAMIAELLRSQDQLRAINRALDVKLNELAESNSALAQAARLKGEFLANISHELRTPMNSVIGFAELLHEAAQGEVTAGDDSTRTAKRVRYLENILTGGRTLLDMINDLLDMARIEAGKMEVTLARINLREACTGLLGLIAPLAERKGLELTLEAEGDLPVVETDPKKLQQIVFNFLSNAVKFTPPKDQAGRAGRVTLRAERLPGGSGGADGTGAAGAGEAPDRVRISVIDTGPGIAPEHQGHIFDKFHTVDTGHTKEHKGAGLGLAISRELATMLQGEIQLVSEPGRGSMFSLILPLALSEERAAENRLEATFRGALSRGKAWA